MQRSGSFDNTVGSDENAVDHFGKLRQLRDHFEEGSFRDERASENRGKRVRIEPKVALALSPRERSNPIKKSAVRERNGVQSRTANFNSRDFGVREEIEIAPLMIRRESLLLAFLLLSLDLNDELRKSGLFTRRVVLVPESLGACAVESAADGAEILLRFFDIAGAQHLDQSLNAIANE